MKAKALLLSLTLWFAGAAAALAQSSQMGTWKLDEAKSKMATGIQRVTTATYEAQDNNVKVTTEGIGADGQPLHTEWTGKFDGKDYPITGDPSVDTRSYTKVDDRTLTITNKKGGETTATARIVVSVDGKTRTVTVDAADAAGNARTSIAVYDKQ